MESATGLRSQCPVRRTSAAGVLFASVALCVLPACGDSESKGDPSATAGASARGGESNGGSSASGGTPGNGGSSAGSPGVPPRVKSSKLDLLLMVDNSISMMGKQRLLRDAVPVLVNRLIRPLCLDSAGAPTGETADIGGGCITGAAQFRPVEDIHIGVITSSLGAHGGQVCDRPEQDDKARLLPSMRPLTVPAVATWNNSGFLAWDPNGTQPRNNPQGERDASNLTSNFQNMVAQAGETGCGYESSLEAVYRFLIDPDPPSQIRVQSDANGTPLRVESVFEPPDTTLLAQRAAFLRPDSTLAIVLLTDENDCSIRDEGQAFLVGLLDLPAGMAFHLPRSTSVCATNPNSPCCLPCPPLGAAAPAECGNLAVDPECARGNYPAQEDNASLRCFDQKRRFGFDLLHPISRYVEGLTSPTVPSRRLDANGAPVRVENPLYAGTPKRSPAQVFLMGIVGVPWQDIVTEASLAGPEHEYMTYQELTANDRWSLILGSGPTGLPRDALMLETPADRSTLGLPAHPLLNVAVAPPTAAANANPINGHETQIFDNSELQYACTYPLPSPVPCDDPTRSCECDVSQEPYRRSICQGTTQTHDRAYPGVRHLQLLKAFGEKTNNSVVASICPRTVDTSQPNHGYLPAIDALIERLTEGLEPAPGAGR